MRCLTREDTPAAQCRGPSQASAAPGAPPPSVPGAKIHQQAGKGDPEIEARRRLACLSLCSFTCLCASSRTRAHPGMRARVTNRP